MLFRSIHKVGEDAFPALFQVKRADILAQSTFKRDEKLERVSKWQSSYEEIKARNQCISLKELAVTGSDLIAAGINPGKKLGETLQQLLEQVLENPELNTKEQLLSIVRKDVIRG